MALDAATPRVTYAGNGSATQFPIADGGGNGIYFESRSHIKVGTYETSTDTWVDLAEGVGYTILNGPLNGIVETIGSPIPTGTTLVIWRETPLDQAVEFGNNSSFASQSHNELADRHRRIDQEIADGVDRAMKLNRSGESFDAQGVKIRNVADATEPSDVASFGQIQSSVEAAEAASVTAEAAAATAEAAAATATSEASTAVAAAASASADSAILNAELSNWQAIISDSENVTVTPFTQLMDDVSAGFDGIEDTFDLEVGGIAKEPASASQILVHVGGAYQRPGAAYTVSGSTITFDFAPAAGLSCDILWLQTEIAS